MNVPIDYAVQAVEIFAHVCKVMEIPYEDAEKHLDKFTCMENMDSATLTAIAAGYIAAIPKDAREDFFRVINDMCKL